MGKITIKLKTKHGTTAMHKCLHHDWLLRAASYTRRLSETWKLFFFFTEIFSGCCHLVFSQPTNKGTRSKFFWGVGGQKHLLIEECLTDLMVGLGAVLTDADHMTPQHRQTTYKVLDCFTEKITLVTRKNML